MAGRVNRYEGVVDTIVQLLRFHTYVVMAEASRAEGRLDLAITRQRIDQTKIDQTQEFQSDTTD